MDIWAFLRKSSPKSKFWGRISRGRPRGYPGGRPGPKASVRPPEAPEKQAFRRGHPWPERADIHDPRGVKEHFGEKNIGLNFRSLFNLMGCRFLQILLVNPLVFLPCPYVAHRWMNLFFLSRKRERAMLFTPRSGAVAALVLVGLFLQRSWVTHWILPWRRCQD